MKHSSFMRMKTKGKSSNCCTQRAAAPCSSSRGISVHVPCCFAPSPPTSRLSHPHTRQKSRSPQIMPAFPLAALLGLPGTVHVRDLGDELGGEDVDLLVGAVQQAQCPDLVCGGRIVSGGFSFLAAVGGLESCDFGGLVKRVSMIFSLVSRFSHLRALPERIVWDQGRTSFLWCKHS